MIFNDPEAQIRRSRHLKRVMRQSAAEPSPSLGVADDEASEPQRSTVAVPPAVPKHCEDSPPQHTAEALPDSQPEAMQVDEVCPCIIKFSHKLVSALAFQNVVLTPA